MALKLTAIDHRRDIAGLKYVYPVLSRRSGGLSIGINFNTNNACNWRCIYCQVTDLKLGAAPEMDFQRLEEELSFLLNTVLSGDFYNRFEVAENMRVIKDIAISGNGEPTSLPDFPRAVELIGRIAADKDIFPASRFVLITNGSLIHQTKAREGLRKLNQFGGEVWFKLDSATEAGRRLINNTGQSLRSSLNNLLLSASLCPTKIQTCLIDIDNKGLPLVEQDALLKALKLIKEQTSVRQVMLYTIARTSLQPEASRLAKLSHEAMNAFAEEIRRLGFEVSVDG
jgi:wyosine [tRNA(Phe)-imidazoG37] synthetase (radical SAM superfamily)